MREVEGSKSEVCEHCPDGRPGLPQESVWALVSTGLKGLQALAGDSVGPILPKPPPWPAPGWAVPHERTRDT